MSKKLKKIMQKKRNERKIELRKYAKELGVSLFHLEDSSGTWFEETLIERIRDAERSQRESRLRIIVFVAAIAAILSAAAAWIAVLKK